MQNNKSSSDFSWIVQFPQETTFKNKVMGWIMSQNRLEVTPVRFSTLEQAVEACNLQGVSYYLEKPNVRKHDRKSYADNFKWKGPE